MNDPKIKPSLIRVLLLLAILVLSMAGVWWLINWSLTGALSTVLVSEGNVASQDVMSPYAVTYQSQVLTAARQQQAADEVEPIYTRADFSIARQQLNQPLEQPFGLCVPTSGRTGPVPWLRLLFSRISDPSSRWLILVP